MTIEVPYKILNKQGREIINPLYNELRGKRFIIINDTDRYIIDNIKTKSDKFNKIKTCEIKSYDYDLAKKDFTCTGLTRPLYKFADDTVEVSDGILNILEQETSWKVGHVDRDAVYDTGLYEEMVDLELASSLDFKNLQRETVILDKNITINIGEKALDFKISYNKVVCNDTNGEYVKTDSFTHTFNRQAQGIKHIKATYGINDVAKNVIKYEFTLNDNFIVKEEQECVFLDNLNVKFTNITLSYSTGNKVEQQHKKYRWFDKGVKKWLPFLRNDVSKAFGNLVFTFDTVNKIVNCYNAKTFGTDKGLFMSYDNFIVNLNKTERVDEVLTRLYVQGKDNLQITSVNPLGTSYIEDFTYLINEGNMSEELQEALKRYDVLANSLQTEWDSIRATKNEKTQRTLYIQSKLTELNEKIKAQNRLKISYMSQQEGTSNPFINQCINNCTEEINKLQGEINTLMNELHGLSKDIQELDDKIKQLNFNLDRKNSSDSQGKIFTEDDLIELDESIYADGHQDDFFSTSYGLYENAKEVLKRKNTLPIKFTTDVENITALPGGWKDYLGIGDLAIIDDAEIEKSVENGYVRVIEFEYIPSCKGRNEEIKNIVFSNEEEQVDKLNNLKDIGKKSEYNKTMTDFWKTTWENSGRTNDFVQDMLDRGLNTAASVIRSRASINETKIDESGIWCIDRSNGDDNNQIVLTGGFLGITNDGWKTCSLCMDSNGIIADRLIGNQVFGKNLIASSELGTFKIDGNGMTIYDEFKRVRVLLGVYEKDGVKKAGLTMYDKSGNSVVLSEDGISSNDSIMSENNLDPLHNMMMPIYLNPNVKEVRSAKLFLFTMQYRAFVKGMSSSPSHIETTSSGGGISKSTANGGGVTITSSAGGATVVSKPSSTSSTNGEHRHKLFTHKGYGTGSPPSEFNYYGFNGSPNGGNWGAFCIPINSLESPGSVDSDIYTYTSNGSHTHHIDGISVPISSHNHSVSLSPHNHYFQAEPHTHEIFVQSHTHVPEFKIWEEHYPSNISLIINGKTVKTGINGNVVIDIAEHLELNKCNIIELSSDTNGRINAMLSMNLFVAF